MVASPFTPISCTEVLKESRGVCTAVPGFTASPRLVKSGGATFGNCGKESARGALGRRVAESVFGFVTGKESARAVVLVCALAESARDVFG